MQSSQAMSEISQFCQGKRRRLNYMPSSSNHHNMSSWFNYNFISFLFCLFVPMLYKVWRKILKYSSILYGLDCWFCTQSINFLIVFLQYAVSKHFFAVIYYYLGIFQASESFYGRVINYFSIGWFPSILSIQSLFEKLCGIFGIYQIIINIILIVCLVV